MIEIKDLHKIYNKRKNNEFYALKGVSLSINDREMVAIIGKSGAGKSTLIHIIGCIDGFDSGEVLFDGDNIFKANEKKLAKYRNKNIGIVLQDFALIPDFTVAENIEIPLLFANIAKRKRKDLVENAMVATGIFELSEKSTNQLSGGQKQRVAIARAIVNSPQYLLADEPTGALDTETTNEIMELFKKLNFAGMTVIIITHYPEVSQQCQRIITISDGLIV